MINRTVFYFCILLIIVLQGCFSPIGLINDNASSLGKNNFSFAGNYSIYSEDDRDTSFTDLVESYGMRLGYGLSAKTTVYLGYHFKEGFARDIEANRGWNYFESELQNSLQYAEFGFKFPLAEKKMAAKISGGIYFTRSEISWALNPAIIYTYTTPGNKFEISAITHGLFVAHEEGGFYGGLNFSAGFGKDLNKWVIRPEIGFLLPTTISYSLGFENKF